MVKDEEEDAKEAEKRDQEDKRETKGLLFLKITEESISRRRTHMF